MKLSILPIPYIIYICICLIGGYSSMLWLQMRPSHSIWECRCLTVPSQYLKQYWLLISRQKFHNLSAQASILYNVFECYVFKISAISPRGQWIYLLTRYLLLKMVPEISGLICCIYIVYNEQYTNVNSLFHFSVNLFSAHCFNWFFYLSHICQSFLFSLQDLDDLNNR